KEELSHLEEALNHLELPDRELLTLAKLQNIRYNELAVIMDSTPGAVKAKVFRAIQKLKTIYFKDI
ncbi:hypothetical protein MKP05_21595, partial [Halomonas sp. EGI 63088]